MCKKSGSESELSYTDGGLDAVRVLRFGAHIAVWPEQQFALVLAVSFRVDPSILKPYQLSLDLVSLIWSGIGSRFLVDGILHDIPDQTKETRLQDSWA